MRHPSQVDHEIGDLLALLYVDDAIVPGMPVTG